MKVSLNWIKQLIDFELPPVDELVERIGAQLGAVEEVEYLGEKYKGVLVAKVVSCVDHPDSDHMHVCRIDDGGRAPDVERDENGYVQVVCGASNVREGLTVAWLPPGSTVPESVGKDPFVLGKRELRGVMSNGMLASPRELALGDSHEGILEIDKDAAPGSDFADVYKLDDYIIDIENKMFTHRPDCFGALGVAREIAGILGHQFKSPEWYQPNPGFAGKVADLPLHVTDEIPELVPRFSAVTIADVQLGPSPIWLQVALAKVGQKSISNIVDLTNFYMLLTGQPLHAYDYDKVRALTGGESAEITVRHPHPGEKIKLINGKEIEPRDEAMMIASGGRLIGIGGVMGGFDTEIDENTKNIILEAASFDMYNIRRTSMAHGLFTDAVTRFNKGQSPLQTLAVLAKITQDIQKMAGGKVAGELIDVSQVTGRDWMHPPIEIGNDFINQRLGLTVGAATIKTLLENVEFHVAVLPWAGHTITAPFWRTDIESREDVVEEVGRLYGFDKLPLELPQRSIKPATKDLLLTLKSDIREVLSKAGANEVLTYSFVHGDLLDKVGQDKAQAFQIGNALSPDLQYYRLSLTPSLLDKVYSNVRAGYDKLALFEIGKAHVHGEPDPSEPTIPKEVHALGFVYTSKTPEAGAAYYEARKYLDTVLTHFQAMQAVVLEPLHGADLYNNPWLEQMAAPFDVDRSSIIRDLSGVLPGTKGLIWGIVGEYKPAVRKALKLPGSTAGFELDPLLLTAKAIPAYVPLPRFPKVSQDITFKVPSGITYMQLYTCFKTELERVRPDQTFVTLEPLDIYQREDDLDHKQITFRLSIASYERTLTDKEVQSLLETIAVALQREYGAERI